MNIRAVTTDDLNVLARLHTEVFNAPPWDESWTQASSNKRISHFMQYPGALAYGMFDPQNNLLAYMVGNIVPAMGVSDFELHEILVRNDQQNQGLGSKLMQHLVSNLNARNIAAIHLMTEKGTPAGKFYQKLGFETDGDTISLWLRIDPDTE